MNTILRAGELVTASRDASNPFVDASNEPAESRTQGALFDRNRTTRDHGTAALGTHPHAEPARICYPQHEGATEQQDTALPSSRGQAGLQPRACGRSESDTTTDEGMPTDGAGCHTRESGCSSEEQETASPAESVAPLSSDDDEELGPPVRHSAHELGVASQRLNVLEQIQAWKTETGCSSAAACAHFSVSQATFGRWARDFAKHGLIGLAPRYRQSGRRPVVTLTDAERQSLCALYLQTNRADEAGSMRTAAKMFALQVDTREELRAVILAAAEAGRVPDFVRKALSSVTRVHFAAKRAPGMLTSRHFSGNRGAFAQDKIDRLRIVESDDGTLNIVACIPWELGGDPCSDAFGVRVGRWQLLPAIEAGWSHFVLGYTLVARPRGSYRTEDIRALIQLVAHRYGLPDAFRFERGAWESRTVTELLESLGVELKTVYKPTSKPFIEGFFNKLWTSLSVAPGQVGRFRGEEEEANRMQAAARAGRVDPREHFPMLSDVIRAVDGAIALHNSDTIHSTYGKWVPSRRHEQLSAARPWRRLQPELAYLFSPFQREWTVARGTVGGLVPILDDYSAPFHFAHEELWRWNGSRVRTFFDPTAQDCRATIVAIDSAHGYRAGDVICEATVTGELPHFCRAAVGWAQDSGERSADWRRAALAAVRRDVRSLTPDGRVASATIEQSDGRGGMVRIEAGDAPRRSAPRAPRASKISAPRAPLPDDWQEMASPAPASAPRRSSYAVSMEELEEL